MDYSQSQSSGGKTTVIHALRVADNLPEDASHDWLTRMFNDYGVVKEVFIIPAKRSRASGNKLGLVRYDCHVSADIATLRHGLKRREIRHYLLWLPALDRKKITRGSRETQRSKSKRATSFF